MTPEEAEEYMNTEEEVDEKPDSLPELTKRYYRIKEVAELMGEEASTLRFWEKSFAKLGNGYLCTRRGQKDRLYTKEQIENMRMVQYLLRKKKLTIQGAIDHILHKKFRNPQERALVALMDVRKELQAMLNSYEFIIARDNFQNW